MEKDKPMSSDALVLLNKLHDQCMEMLDGLTFDKEVGKDGLLVGTYASLIELTGGILVLAYYNRYSSLSPVFRAFLETYVDFKNLFDDPKYVAYVTAKHHANWIRVLKKDKPNPYLAGIQGHDEFAESLRRHEEKLAELQKQGVNSLNVRDRFERAGMLDEYESVYHFESDGAHNSLQAFISRHVEMREDTFGLALYKKRAPDEYDSRLLTTAECLLDATEKLHQRLESKHLERIGALKKELSVLQAKLLEKERSRRQTDPTDNRHERILDGGLSRSSRIGRARSHAKSMC